MKQQNHSAAHVPGSATRPSNPAISLFDTTATGFPGIPDAAHPGIFTAHNGNMPFNVLCIV